MKTTRFKEIVALCGRPDVYVSWSKPESDPQLMKALKQQRVMTLHQTLRGSAKDFGTVGLLADAHAQILIFPRSLKKFAELRVIGIDYNSFAGAASKSRRNPARPAVTKRRALARSESTPDALSEGPDRLTPLL